MIPLGDENPFRDNPYASPDSPSSSTPFQAPPVQLYQRGMVRHVRVIAVLMIVQGGLEVLMGLLWIGMGLFWQTLIAGEMARQGGGPGPPPEEMRWVMLVMFGLFGALVLGLATLHIVAGIRNYKFRSRVLGIVALIGGMLTMLLGCYCAPSAIALGVWGLVCYMNPEVIQAFDLTTRSNLAPVGTSGY